MSFSVKQLSALRAPLSRSHVKTRKQAGRDLSYVEGWHAIAEANRIFGHDKWNRETIEMRELGAPRETNGKFRVAFSARVKISVWCPGATFDDSYYIVREGCGYGSGIAADLGDAYESAIKEAETDAMKRALMTFGNPFGLALYDKEQENVTDEEEPDTHDESKELYLRTCRETIKTTPQPDKLPEWWKEEAQNRRDFNLTQEDVDELKAVLREALAKLPKEAA